MKYSHVAIILILFQVSWIRATNNRDEPTTSGDPQGTEEGDQPEIPPNAEDPVQEIPWHLALPTPVFDEKERKLLDAVEFNERRDSRKSSRSNSLKSNDGSENSDDEMFSLSDEDETDAKDWHNIPRHKKYWPKNLPHIGSMTPYRFLFKTVPKDLEYFKPREERELYKDCSVVRTWNLFRHGIRYPSKETSHGMRTRLRNFKESILMKIFENPEIFSSTTDINMKKFLKYLNKWDVVPELSKGVVHVSDETLNKRKTKAEIAEELANLTALDRATREKNKGGADEEIKEAKALTPLGKTEMEEMGTRFKNRFQSLLENLDSEDLLFKFTDCQRTRESALAVYSSIYQKPADDDDTWYEPIDTGDDGKDPLLKYDALCAHWKKNYKKSELNMHQLDRLITGNYVKNVLRGLTAILNFPKNSITFNDGRLLYESCAFEKAWNIKAKSPWCELMTEDYLAVYEYLEDYEFFKNDGPDNDMNKGVGCFLFNDMVDRLIGEVKEVGHGNIFWNLHLEEDGTDQGIVQTTIPDETDSPKSQTSETEAPESKISRTGSVEKILEELGKDKKESEQSQTSETEAPESKISRTGSAEKILEELGKDKKESEPTDDKAEKSEKTEKSKREKKPTKKATFYFTHLTAILKFITHLGVHTDKEHLTPYNFDDMKDRKWRSARIGAFGTNISFVLMKCNKSYFILALHQERPLRLPNCPNELCPVGTFLKAYKDSIFDCDYEEMCEKYKHRFFNRSMSPYKDDIPSVDLRSLNFSSKSSSGSSRRSSFGSTKEVY